MKIATRALACVLGALLVAGCATTRGERVGTGLGAMTGAVAGAVIDRKNPWRGGVLGGAAGGLLGYAIGNAASEPEGAPPCAPQPAYTACPACGRTFGPEARFCPADGTALMFPRP